VDVQKHKVQILASRKIDRLPAIGRLEDLGAVGSQGQPNHTPRGQVVIDNEDARPRECEVR
jgi:hypothetical protein